MEKLNENPDPKDSVSYSRLDCWIPWLSALNCNLIQAYNQESQLSKEILLLYLLDVRSEILKAKRKRSEDIKLYISGLEANQVKLLRFKEYLEKHPSSNEDKSGIYGYYPDLGYSIKWLEYEIQSSKIAETNPIKNFEEEMIEIPSSILDYHLEELEEQTVSDEPIDSDMSDDAFLDSDKSDVSFEPEDMTSISTHFTGPIFENELEMVHQKIIKLLSGVKSTLLIANFNFSDGIYSNMEILLNLLEKDVKITIICDFDQAHSKLDSWALFVLSAKGAEVYVNIRATNLMHNKFVVFDNSAVQTGSFNNKSTTSYFESVIFLQNSQYAESYKLLFYSLINSPLFTRAELTISWSDIVNLDVWRWEKDEKRCLNLSRNHLKKLLAKNDFKAFMKKDVETIIFPVGLYYDFYKKRDAKDNF